MSAKGLGYSAGAFSRPTIHENELAPLGALPFHFDVQAITRRCPDAFPIHVAAHEISGISSPPGPYTEPHCHPIPELKLLITPPGELVYRLVLDGETQEVASPTSGWIPAGVRHAANVVCGRGTSVCALFTSTADAFPDLRA